MKFIQNYEAPHASSRLQRVVKNVKVHQYSPIRAAENRNLVGFAAGVWATIPCFLQEPRAGSPRKASLAVFTIIGFACSESSAVSNAIRNINRGIGLLPTFHRTVWRHLCIATNRRFRARYLHQHPLRWGVDCKLRVSVPVFSNDIVIARLPGRSVIILTISDKASLPDDRPCHRSRATVIYLRAFPERFTSL
jgi:hypothetical protein